MTTTSDIMARRVAELEAERDAARQARRDAQELAERYQDERNKAGVQARREVAEQVRKLTIERDEARREGAEAMREAVESLREDADEIFPPTGRGRQAPVEARDVVEWYSESIRALPLPTGKRQAVRLTDAEVKQIGNATLYAGGIYDRVRAIESAVLAANGLEVRRG